MINSITGNLGNASESTKTFFLKKKRHTTNSICRPNLDPTYNQSASHADFRQLSKFNHSLGIKGHQKILCMIMMRNFGYVKIKHVF